MRDIKFRAWNKHDKAWRKEFLVTMDGELCFGEYPEGGWNTDDFNKYILMQYTGLKDGNGKEIYEGDIVEYRYYDNSGGKGEVNFREGGFYVDEAHPFNQLYPRGFEVIGNIYENEELVAV